MLGKFFITVWLCFPLYFGNFIPLSFFTVAYLIINPQHKVKVSKRLLYGLISVQIYIILQSFIAGEFQKDILRYTDLTLVCLTAREFTKHISNGPLLHHIVIIIIPFLISLNFSILNANYPAIAVLLVFVILQNRKQRKSSFITSLSTYFSYVFEVYTLFVGFIAYFFRIKPIYFICGFSILILIIWLTPLLLSMLLSTFPSALIRLDLWVGSISKLAETDMITTWMFGMNETLPQFSNSSYQNFSGFLFSGYDPHNIFIYHFYQYGVIGLALLIFVLIVGLDTKFKKIIFIPLFVSFWFEASVSFMYFGVLGIIFSLPRIGAYK